MTLLSPWCRSHWCVASCGCLCISSVSVAVIIVRRAHDNFLVFDWDFPPRRCFHDNNERAFESSDKLKFYSKRYSECFARTSHLFEQEHRIQKILSSLRQTIGSNTSNRSDSRHMFIGIILGLSVCTSVT